FHSGRSPRTCAIHGVSRSPPTMTGSRCARARQVTGRFSVRVDQNDPTVQLMSQAIQMRASNSVGQVASHPLQTEAKIGWALSGMCLGEVGYGFAQSGFNGPWGIA